MHMQAELAELRSKLAKKEMGLAEKESIEELSEYPSPTSELEVLEQKHDELMQRRSLQRAVTCRTFFGATLHGNMAFQVR